jgi:hypothetical protein
VNYLLDVNGNVVVQIFLNHFTLAIVSSAKVHPSTTIPKSLNVIFQSVGEALIVAVGNATINVVVVHAGITTAFKAVTSLLKSFLYIFA